MDDNCKPVPLDENSAHRCERFHPVLYEGGSEWHCKRPAKYKLGDKYFCGYHTAGIGRRKNKKPNDPYWFEELWANKS